MSRAKVVDPGYYGSGVTKSVTDTQAIVSVAALVKPVPGGMHFGTPVFATNKASGRVTEPRLCVDSKFEHGKRVFGVDITRHQSPDFRGKDEIPATVAIQGLITVNENTGSYHIERGDIVLCLPHDKFAHWARQSLQSGFEGAITVPLRLFRQGMNAADAQLPPAFAWQEKTYEEVLLKATAFSVLDGTEAVGRSAALEQIRVAAAASNDHDDIALTLLLEFENPQNPKGAWAKAVTEHNTVIKLLQWLHRVWTASRMRMGDYILGMAQEPARPGEPFSILLCPNNPTCH
jgi:hypothetical protein